MKHHNFINFLLVAVAFIFGLIACSEDDGKATDPISDNEVSEKVLAKICIDWGVSQSEVASKMKRCQELYKSSDIAKYGIKDASYTISYMYDDGKLKSSILSIPLNDRSESQNVFDLNDYTYIGDVDGANVYSSTEKNTMCLIVTRNADGIDYLVVGFTPLDSDMFDKFNPIEITTLEASEIAERSFTMNASISGVESQPKVYFEISENIDMSKATKYNASVSNQTATYTVTNLKPNLTYYYRAYLMYDDIRYDGQVEMVELKKMQTYQIGDPYPSFSNVEGIVCYVSDNGTHGTIISLDQDMLMWDREGLFCHDYSSNNSYDGSKNNMGTVEPFAKWVYEHGPGWFGPARKELVFSKTTLKMINDGLRSVGGKELNGFYWSSTQHSSNTAYVVTVTESGYMGYSNQYEFYNSKNQKNSVRAMKDF